MDNDPWLSASDVADELGVSRSTIWRMDAEQLPYVLTRGKQRRYRRSDVLRVKGVESLADRVARLEHRMDRHEAQHSSPSSHVDG